MKDQTDYEIKKQINKQKLVRNEFLYYGKSSDKYEFPIIKKQQIDVEKIKFLSYVNAKKDDAENKDKTVHFFTYDWLFEKVYENAEEEIEKLSQYYALLSPDFSMFTNMPVALQIESVFKNRWCGAYFQSKGLKVIPTISWGDIKSFDFCFDAIEQGSVVAVCTYYRENCEEEFMLGYNKMLEKIKPSFVICYDELFPKMKGNVKSFLPTTYEWTKSLSWQDQVRFHWEKHNRNIIGLNKNDFKFIDYEDPYEKTEIKKCDVCGKIVLVDQYENGQCENCGWWNDKSRINHPNKIMYPNIVSLNKAKDFFKKGEKFNPSFDDFIEALQMYSEMAFEYMYRKYGVILLEDGTEFFEYDNYSSTQKYKTVQEFKNKALIENRLLKDIWNEIKNADYMQD